MPCMLSAQLFVGKSVYRIVGLHFVRFFSGNHVAGNDQHFGERVSVRGTAMFTLLTMAGDLGGSIGPGLVGRVIQMSEDNICAGMRVGILFPAALLLALVIFSVRRRGACTSESN